MFGAKSVEQECRQKFVSWCMDFAYNGYDPMWTASNFFNAKNSQCQPFGLPGTTEGSFVDTPPDYPKIKTIKEKCGFPV